MQFAVVMMEEACPYSQVHGQRKRRFGVSNALALHRHMVSAHNLDMEGRRVFVDDRGMMKVHSERARREDSSLRMEENAHMAMQRCSAKKDAAAAVLDPLYCFSIEIAAD